MAIAAGCGNGSLDGAALANDIEAELKRQNKVRTVEVTCPGKIKKQARLTVTCSFRTDASRGAIKVFQQDDKGSVRWEVQEDSIRRL